MEVLTPAFSKTCPSCKTQDMPPPPVGLFQVSVRNFVPSRFSRAWTMMDCCSFMKLSMRRRMGELEVMPDSRLARVSLSAMVGPSVRSTGEVSWHACESVGG